MHKKYFEGELRESTNEFLKKIESETTENHTVTIMDKTFEVFPSVFSPKYFIEPEFFISVLPVKPGETFLEMGCGSGVISIFAIFKGVSKVVAIDINSKAVENTWRNAELHNVQDKIRVLEGDVFEPLQDEKFDTIFWNTPWGLVREEHTALNEIALWDTEYKSTRKFIEGAHKYLNENGRVLIGFSSTIGDLEFLKRILQENGYEFRIVEETDSHAVNFFAKFEIIEARLKKIESS
jgi:methylase of polypeptide subunit release factors